MGRFRGKHPIENTTGSGAGDTRIEVQVVDSAGNRVAGQEPAPFRSGGSNYDIDVPLTPAQITASAGGKGQTRAVNPGGTASDWSDVPFPTEGLTPAKPNPPSDNTLSNS